MNDGTRAGMTSGLVSSLVTLSLAAAAAALVACDRKDNDAPAPFASAHSLVGGFNQPRRGKSFSIGERAEVPELAVTVEDTKQCPVENLKQGNFVLGVELSVEGRSATEIHFNPFHCKLRGADGSTYTPTFRGCNPRLRDHRLGTGERQTGWVSFELPAQVKDLELVCSQAVMGQPDRVLEFDLSGG